MKYQLTCECGQKHPVGLAQAGEMIRCSCGAELAVPALRELKSLPPADEKAQPTQRRASWNASRGMVFGIGATVLVAGAVALGVVQLYIAGLHTEKPAIDEAHAADYVNQVDRLEPADTLEYWREHVVKAGLSRPGTPTYVRDRRLEVALKGFRATFLGVFAVGLALVIGSMLMGRGRA